MRAAITILFMAAACTHGGSTPPPAEAAKPLEIVGKRVDITVLGSSYEPAEVTIRVGEPSTLVFTRTSPSECGGEVMFPSLDIRERLPLNEPVAIALTPTEAGEIAFSCGMRMMKGTVVAVD